VDRPLNVFQRVIFLSFDSADVRSLDPLRMRDNDTDAGVTPGLRDLPFALLDEREQVAVDEIGMRGGQAV
jgi:hypothetical protein